MEGFDISTLGAAASGGLFGVIGGLINRGIGLIEAKQRRQDRQMEMAHEEKRWSNERTLLDMQMRARSQETEQEVVLADTRGSWDALQASYDAEARIGESYRWVNAVRGLTRPALTVLLWLMAGYFFAFVADAVLRGEIIKAVLFSANAATLWWFGARDNKGKGEAS